MRFAVSTATTQTRDSHPSHPYHSIFSVFCGVHRHYTQTCVLRCPPQLFAVSTAILLILALCSLNARADLGPHSFLPVFGRAMASQDDLEDRTFWTAECPWPRCMTRVVKERPWDVRQQLVHHFKFQHGMTYEVSHQSTWFAVTTAHRHTHTHTHTHTHSHTHTHNTRQVSAALVGRCVECTQVVYEASEVSDGETQLPWDPIGLFSPIEQDTPRPVAAAHFEVSCR